MVDYLVKKNTGETEIFDREKLRTSLLNSSASIILTNEAIGKVEEKIHDGITTHEIYKIAFDFIKKKDIRTASRYAVKRSLLTLGPTGFPFEKFVARIFRKKGFQTLTGTMVRGKCVEHEIDLVAYNENEVIISEIKYHNDYGTKTDTKVALYVKARFDDVKSEKIQLPDGKFRLPTRGILITNTEFTETAEKYSKCADIELISWNYPAKGNLYSLIDETNAHPITVMITLTKAQKEFLINNEVICCDEIKNNLEVLRKIVSDETKISNIIREAEIICEK